MENAKYITQLLGDENAVLVENEAVGHTTLAQYSTCTHNIVSDFLLNSQVGYGLTLLLPVEVGLTGRGFFFSQLPQKYTKCPVDSNDFFPDAVTNVRRYLWRR